MKKKLEKLFTWPTEKPNVSAHEYHWFGYENAVILHQAISERNPKYILEMGSWNGSGSTRYILQNAPNAHLVCIDHWSNNENDYVQEECGIEEIRKLWYQIEILFETFLVNTWEYQDRLTPFKAKTIDGLEQLGKMNIPFDIIYIDAHHDYESVLYDIETSHKLWPNATIVGDDYTWAGVKQAAHEFAEKNNIEIVVKGNCYYYKK
jgi:predicted O-methyltransferase YrrM